MDIRGDFPLLFARKVLDLFNDFSRIHVITLPELNVSGKLRKRVPDTYPDTGDRLPPWQQIARVNRKS